MGEHSWRCDSMQSLSPHSAPPSISYRCAQYFSHDCHRHTGIGTCCRFSQATWSLLPEKFCFSYARPSLGEFLLTLLVSAKMELLPESFHWTLYDPPSWHPRVPATSIFGSSVETGLCPMCLMLYL